MVRSLNDNVKSRRLGSRLAARIARIGLAKEIPELRGPPRGVSIDAPAEGGGAP